MQTDASHHQRIMTGAKLTAEAATTAVSTVLSKRTDDKGGEGRGRFKSGQDYLEQLLDIEKAQEAVRKGKLNKLIDDIEKSARRLANDLDVVKTLKDAIDLTLEIPIPTLNQRKVRKMEKNPRSSDPYYKGRFEEAVRERDEGRFHEANQMLLKLEEENPRDLAIALVRAGVLLKMDKFQEASELFGKITRSRPDADLASRGLFHSLWKLGRYDEAFEEMKRFLSIADSEGYLELLGDLKASLNK